jgi:PPOX class probable F420-dependent enzyme
MAKLTAAQQAFLRDNPFPGVTTTLRPDGSPHATVVWIDEDGGDVLFNTVVGRAKERHLRQNPNVSVTVVDPEDQYRWISVSGRATLDTEGAHEHINKLSHKYLGKDYPWYNDTDQRIIARISVDKVDATGFD